MKAKAGFVVAVAKKLLRPIEFEPEISCVQDDGAEIPVHTHQLEQNRNGRNAGWLRKENVKQDLFDDFGR